MYLPRKYQKTDNKYIFEFIKNHPFATLVVAGENLIATHIPVFTEGTAENFRMVGHIAHHNKQLQFLKDDAEVLLIFQGAHGYVSSSWYQEKDISTWDYSAVHVNAKITVQSEPELRNSLKNLVEIFENQQEKPLFYSNIPSEMLEEHIPQITGFYCTPFKIEAVAKLHQSYSTEDKKAVVEKLENSGNPEDALLAKDIIQENNLK